MNHLIQRQVIDVRLSSNQKAAEQQEAIRQLYWERIVPALDKVFSKIVPHDVTLRIDQLKLDLGIVPKDNLVSEITQQLTEQLGDILFQAKYEQQIESSSTISSSNAQAKRKKFHLLDHKESEVKALIYFLKNGIFPWWFNSDIDTSPVALLEKIVLEKPQELVRFLENHNDTKVQTRLIEQFSEVQLLDLAKVKNDYLSEILSYTVEACLKIDASNFSTQKRWETVVRLSIRRTTLFLLTKSPSKSISTLDLGNIILAHISKHLQKSVDKIQSFLIDEIQQNPIKNIRSNTKNEIKPSFEILRDIFDLEKKLTKEIDFREDDAENSTIHNKSNDISEKSVDSEQDLPLNSKSKVNSEAVKKDNHKIIQTELEEGIYISNAGLSLLAPFFQMYLEAIGLVKDQKFISPEAQERAILLSQYLVSDQTSISEHELILNKIIMGWDLDDPLASTIDLTKKEKEESQDLLNSALNHWGALGNSGVPALQETFLQREGKLIYKDDQYKLIVERKTIDILMDKIPWSFSTLKLPWMDKRIQVEW